MADSSVANKPISDYEQVGGAPAVTAVVQDFYQRVLSDESLAGYFAGVDMARLKRHQVLLVSQVMGGPAEYDGRELKDAHAGRGIIEPDFERVVGHLVAALESAGVGTDIVGRVVAALGAAEPDIVAAPA